MSPAKRPLRAWMGISALLYASGGLIFLVLPGTLLQALDSFAGPLHLVTVLPGVLAAEPLWNILGFAMTVTITTANLIVAYDPVKKKDFCIPVLFSKTVSWLSALVYCRGEPGLHTLVHYSWRIFLSWY